MKKQKKFIIFFLGLFLTGNLLFSQQEFVLTIKEGVPAISLALPPFILDSSSPQVKQAADTIHQVLKADLIYSRIFQPVPEEHLNYIRPLNPKEIYFKDWESIQTRILVTGEISQSQDKFIFEAKVYDIKSERMMGIL
jgi:hypothetical protein